MTRRPGPYARTDLPTFSGRTKEGALLRGIREELIRHVGRQPDAAQRQLIETVATARVRLAILDRRLAETGDPGDQAAYVSLLANLSRALARLGPPAPPPSPTLADVIAAAAPHLRSPGTAAGGDGGEDAEDTSEPLATGGVAPGEGIGA